MVHTLSTQKHIYWRWQSGCIRILQGCIPVHGVFTHSSWHQVVTKSVDICSIDHIFCKTNNAADYLSEKDLFFGCQRWLRHCDRSYFRSFYSSRFVRILPWVKGVLTFLMYQKKGFGHFCWFFCQLGENVTNWRPIFRESILPYQIVDNLSHIMVSL